MCGSIIRIERRGALELLLRPGKSQSKLILRVQGSVTFRDESSKVMLLADLWPAASPPAAVYVPCVRQIEVRISQTGIRWRVTDRCNGLFEISFASATPLRPRFQNSVPVSTHRTPAVRRVSDARCRSAPRQRRANLFCDVARQSSCRLIASRESRSYFFAKDAGRLGVNELCVIRTRSPERMIVPPRRFHV